LSSSGLIVTKISPLIGLTLLIVFFGHNFPTTNARWPIKSSKDEKTSKLPFEFFSHDIIRKSLDPNQDVTPKKVQSQKCLDFLKLRLEDFLHL